MQKKKRIPTQPNVFPQFRSIRFYDQRLTIPFFILFPPCGTTCYAYALCFSFLFHFFPHFYFISVLSNDSIHMHLSCYQIISWSCVFNFFFFSLSFSLCRSQNFTVCIVDASFKRCMLSHELANDIIILEIIEIMGINNKNNHFDYMCMRFYFSSPSCSSFSSSSSS